MSPIEALIQRSQKDGYFTEGEIVIEGQIKSGTVNQCWKLKSGEYQYLARMSRELPAQFLTNWISEIELNRRAAKIGVAAEPVWLDANSLSAIYPWCGDPVRKEVLSHSLLSRLGEILSRLHSLDSSAKKIGYRQTIESYLNIIRPQEHPRELLRLADHWDQHSALVFCHHDLNPGNILWDGNKLRLIDWEYARTAHPLFDLASLAHNYDLSDEDLEHLLNHYSPDQYSIEEVRLGEDMVKGLEQLWLSAASSSIGN